MVNPFDEDDASELLERELKVFCPYCGTQKGIINRDYYQENAYMNELTVTWECETCERTFKTYHEFDKEGELIDCSNQDSTASPV